MSDAKGIEKFAEEFVVGTVGFIYSAVVTIAIVIVHPIRGPLRFRALKHPEIRPLSAPVAMFLSYLALVLYAASDPIIRQKSPKDLLDLTNLSGLPWYQKLTAVAILYIISDCLVRFAGRLFTRSRRHYYRDCDRLRYAVAGSAFVLLFAFFCLALSTVSRAFDAPLVWLGSLTLFFGTSCLLAIVLGSMMRARFGARRLAARVLVYICALPLIWLGAGGALGVSIAAYNRLDRAFKEQPAPVLPQPQARRVDVPQLLCLLHPDGRVTVSALLQNASESAAGFAPDEFTLTLEHKNSPAFAPLTRLPWDTSPPPPPPEPSFTFPLYTGSDFAIGLAPHEAKLVTFTLSVAANILPWPLVDTRVCYLGRTQRNKLDGAIELGPTIGFARLGH